MNIHRVYCSTHWYLQELMQPYYQTISQLFSLHISGLILFQVIYSKSVHYTLSGLSPAGVGGAVLPEENGKNWDFPPKFSNHSCVSFTSVYVPPQSPPHRRSIPGDSPACYYHSVVGLEKINIMFCHLSWNTTYVLCQITLLKAHVYNPW